MLTMTADYIRRYRKLVTSLLHTQHTNDYTAVEPRERQVRSERRGGVGTAPDLLQLLHIDAGGA
jgi:hypothetical protein